MSYYNIKYEFMGQDSAGLRGGEVQFQVWHSGCAPCVQSLAAQILLHVRRRRVLGPVVRSFRALHTAASALTHIQRAAD